MSFIQIDRLSQPLHAVDGKLHISVSSIFKVEQNSHNVGTDGCELVIHWSTGSGSDSGKISGIATGAIGIKLGL